MKTKILTLLREKDDYVSGQEICRKLDVSRTAVWKTIGALKDAGYEIEAVQNKGYRLVSAPDIVEAPEITSRLKTKWAARPVLFFETIDSTNNEIKRRAESGAVHGTLAISEIQESGKGRRGRSWSSPKGAGIWMSLLIRPDFPPMQASMMTLVAAMAVEKAIDTVTGLPSGIKWPNDIVVGGKKVCGILTEMSAEIDFINYVVIGIGINVNNGPDFPEEIRQVATSIYLEKGEKVNRAAIAAAVWDAFEEYYEKFVQTGDLSLLKEAYEERLVNKDKEVCVLDPLGQWKGIARGIDETGRLMVEKEDGTRKAVDSGEVSVRGVYGYV